MLRRAIMLNTGAPRTVEQQNPPLVTLWLAHQRFRYMGLKHVWVLDIAALALASLKREAPRRVVVVVNDLDAANYLKNNISFIYE